MSIAIAHLRLTSPGHFPDGLALDGGHVADHREDDEAGEYGRAGVYTADQHGVPENSRKTREYL